ncbi:MAG: inverse autotransporter beta domain-containing protein [Candidatus Omnitrophica bacterium]|nr:inverse autotransporter beta domain-containing protein [Candidatus Omnitrophota bacterium]
MKRLILIGVTLSILFWTTLFAASRSEAIENTLLAANLQNSPPLQKGSPEETSTNIPDWIKRTNFNIQAGTDQRPRYFLETVQPLLGTQEKDIVIFNQLRISSSSERPTYNIGLGLRKIFAEKYLLGINSFYDYQDLHQHSRGGVGFEVITDKGFESRLNTYIRISGRRQIAEDSANIYYEKVANGFDWEEGIPLPYLPQLKVYGGGYWYNFEHFKNKYGWKSRLEYTPFKYSKINFEVFDDTKRTRMGYRIEGAISLAFTSFSLKDLKEDFISKQEAYPKVNLRDKVLDGVVRDFNITVITSTKAKGTGLTVEGGKSG